MFKFTDTKEPIKIGDMVYFIDKNPVYSNGTRQYKTIIKSELVQTISNKYINYEMPNCVFTKEDVFYSTEEGCQQQIDFEKSIVFIKDFLSNIQYQKYDKIDIIEFATVLKEYSRYNIITPKFIIGLLPSIENKIITEIQDLLTENCKKCACLDTILTIDDMRHYIEYLSLENLLSLRDYLSSTDYLNPDKKLKFVIDKYRPLLKHLMPKINL